MQFLSFIDQIDEGHGHLIGFFKGRDGQKLEPRVEVVPPGEVIGGQDAFC